MISICFVKPFCFLPPPKHRSKTLSRSADLFLFFATHRSNTLSPSCQRRQAATAKDTSASSAFMHARFLIINLFCEASILSVSRHSPLKEFSSSRQRRQAATILQGLVDKPLSLSFPASLIFLRAHASPLKKCFC